MPAKRRKNNEGSYGTKTIKGVEYKYFRKAYNGVDKYFYGKTDKEVNAKRKKFEENNISITTKDTRKQTFGDYIMTWLITIKQPSIKRRTFDSYEDIILAQIINYNSYDISSKQMATLSEDLFQNYYNDMAKHYSRATLIKNYAIVKQCLDYALYNNHIAEDILKHVSIPVEDLVKVKKKETKILDDDDMIKLYNESNRINEKGFNFGGGIIGEKTYGNNAQAIIILLYTGMRFSEMLALKYKDYDKINNCIYIKNNLNLVKNRNKKSENEPNYINIETTTKTPSSIRRIPLNNEAKIMLQLFENEYPNHSPEDYIVVNKNGKSISKGNITRTLKSMIQRAKCNETDISIHDLRRSFGSYLARHGADPKVAAEIMGHADVSIFYKVYYKTMEEQKEQAMKLFEKE